MLRQVMVIFKEKDDGKKTSKYNDNDDDERVWLLSTRLLHNPCLSLSLWDELRMMSRRQQ